MTDSPPEETAQDSRLPREVAQHTTLNARIRAAWDRLEALSEGKAALPAVARERVDELLEAFAVTLEELQVASEELQQQNDELTVTYEQLHVVQQRYRDLFNLAPGGYVVTDLEGVIQEANHAAGALLGLMPWAVEGKPLALYLADGERVTFYRYLERLRGASESIQVEWETRVRDLQQRETAVVISGKAAGESEHQISGILWLIQDISDLKAAQQALANAEQQALMGRFASSLAHEVGNPLQTVLGSLGLAREALGQERQAHADELLDIGLQELRRAGKILARLRELRRPSEPEAREPTQVNDVIEHALLLTKTHCEKQAVDVVWNAHPDLPAIPAVPYRLHQVFLNLILNAVDAMPDGGTLTLSTELREDTVCARVLDTGTGITEEERAKLFTPFFTTKFSGMGLGLYVTKQIVDEHQGEIQVKSEAGQGTTFVICLPTEE